VIKIPVRTKRLAVRPKAVVVVMRLSGDEGCSDARPVVEYDEDERRSPPFLARTGRGRNRFRAVLSNGGI